MTIGVFQLVKNEASWIGPWLVRMLPFVDEIVIYDGNSTDGTLEIIDLIQHKFDHWEPKKIKLCTNKDPKNLQDSYVEYFDCCMRELSTDLAWFLHPDMWIVNPEVLLSFKNDPCIAAYCEMESFAGEPNGQLYKITSGRDKRWKNIYRLNNPDLGAHYYGWYGSADEDIYFSEITGNKYEHFGQDMYRYPYYVSYSGLKVLHFSDVRSYDRRLERMRTCLTNQGQSGDLALTHPRVTFKSGDGFEFEKAEYPQEWLELNRYFKSFKETACSVS